MKRQKITTLYLSLLIVVTFMLTGIFQSSSVFAYAVPVLPAGNRVNNPWFRSFSDPTKSSLDGWTDEAGLNKYWSSSQKESNPSPDMIISGVCGNNPVYCGTGARLSWRPGQSGGIGKPNVDSYLSQVVSANPAYPQLKFQTYWVSHCIHIAEVVIYGGSSNNGPWTELWTPFLYTDLTPSSEPDLWAQTNLVTKTLSQGYPYYKIRIHAKLTDDVQTGFKITGIYFTSQPVGGQPDPDPTPPSTPTTPVFPHGSKLLFLPVLLHP